MLKRLEERRRFTETVLNGLSAGLITTDGAGKVSFANRAALATLGLSLADCLDRSVVEIFGNNEEVAAVVQGRGRARGGAARLPGDQPGRGPALRGDVRHPRSLRAAGGADLRLPVPQPGGDPGAGRSRRPRPSRDPHRGHRAVSRRAGGAGRSLRSRSRAWRGQAKATPSRRRPVLALRYCTVSDLSSARRSSLRRSLPRRAGPARSRCRSTFPRCWSTASRWRTLWPGSWTTRGGGRAAWGGSPCAWRRPRPWASAACAPARSCGSTSSSRARRSPRKTFTATTPRGRRSEHRRADLATAEQLLQANGGRLEFPAPGPDARALSALIPAARRLRCRS